MRRYVFKTAAQVAGLILVAFVLLRIVGPWLIDLHNTAALILAAALLLAGAFLVAWFVWSLTCDIKTRSGRDL